MPRRRVLTLRLGYAPGAGFARKVRPKAIRGAKPLSLSYQAAGRSPASHPAAEPLRQRDLTLKISELPEVH